MNIINSFFGSSSKKTESFVWNKLDNLAQLDMIVSASSTRKQLIFKHSTRCGISSGVIRQFEKKYATDFDYIDFYYLDLINFRAISNEISERFGVVHQSPQAIILHDGVVIAHDSHYAILELNILE